MGIVPTSLHSKTTWKTLTELTSDHLPILTTINLKRNNTQTHKITYTNYKKADWTQFTEYIDTELANTITEDLNPHQINKIVTSPMNTANKLYITKGKVKQTHQP